MSSKIFLQIRKVYILTVNYSCRLFEIHLYVYRRHKRRASQPVTDNEKRLSVRVPTDDDNDEIAKDDQGKKSDLSMEDFDTLEDFLSVSIGSRRESISWDKQIVEPFFEKLKKEKEKKQSQIQSTELDPSILIPMPRRRRVTEESSNVSCDDESKPNNSSIENASRQEDLLSCSPANDVANHVTETNLIVEKKDEASSVLAKLQNEAAPKENRAASHVDRGSKCVEPDRSVVTCEQEEIVPDNTGSIPTLQSGVPKLRRSLSTQSTHADRRRYFQKLKESRDRRYSQLCLGPDAKTIQMGKVREMIEQHREQILTSQAMLRRASIPEQKLNDGKLYQRRSDSYDRLMRTQSLSPPLQNAKSSSYAPGSVVLRNKREYERKSYCGKDNVENASQQNALIKQKYRSADLETVNVNKRFSTLTTASLPLQFTSSSSSCSSDNEDCSNCNSSRTTPKYKSLFQSQMFLSRSYFQDQESNTRRSRNLVIQASPEIIQKDGKRASLQEPKFDQKFFFREIGKIEADDDLQKDQMSEQVDNVWENFESSKRNNQKGQDQPVKPTNSELTKMCLLDLSEHKTALNISTDKKVPCQNANVDKSSVNSTAKPSASSQNSHQRVENVNGETTDLPQSANQNPKFYAIKQRRPGRSRERGHASSTAGTGPNYVMRLTQQFNQMAASNNPPPQVKVAGRSHSAGLNKHLGNLR